MCVSPYRLNRAHTTNRTTVITLNERALTPPFSGLGEGVLDASRAEGVPNASRAEGVPDASRAEGVPDASRAEGVQDACRAEGVLNASRAEGVLDASRAEGVLDVSRAEDVLELGGIPTETVLEGGRRDGSTYSGHFSPSATPHAS